MSDYEVCVKCFVASADDHTLRVIQGDAEFFLEDVQRASGTFETIKQLYPEHYDFSMSAMNLWICKRVLRPV
jgi:hypothetical protein